MSIALAIEFKLKKLGEWENQVSIRTENNTLTHWQVTGMDQPSQETLDSWVSEYESIGKFEDSFDVVKMRKRLFEILPTLSNFNLRLEIGAFEAFGESKNFVGMKAYTLMLVNAGVASSGDKDKIYSVMLEQGINLNSY